MPNKDAAGDELGRLSGHLLTGGRTHQVGRPDPTNESPVVGDLFSRQHKAVHQHMASIVHNAHPAKKGARGHGKSATARNS